MTVLAFERMPDFFNELNSSKKFAVDSARADSLAKGYAQFRGAMSAQRMNIYTYPGSKQGSCGT